MKQSEELKNGDVLKIIQENDQKGILEFEGFDSVLDILEQRCKTHQDVLMALLIYNPEDQIYFEDLINKIYFEERKTYLKSEDFPTEESFWHFFHILRRRLSEFENIKMIPAMLENYDNKDFNDWFFLAGVGPFFNFFRDVKIKNPWNLVDKTPEQIFEEFIEKPFNDMKENFKNQGEDGLPKESLQELVIMALTSAAAAFLETRPEFGEKIRNMIIEAHEMFGNRDNDYFESIIAPNGSE